MKVLWTLSAEQDRADIIDFIAQDNPLAAILMDEVSPQQSADWLSIPCWDGPARSRAPAS